MLAQTHIKQQLDALRHSNVSGFVRLRVAIEIRANASQHHDDSPRYYGGLAFDPAQSGWQGFGPCRFVLPRIELVRRGECVSLCLNLWLDENNLEAELQAAEAALDALRPEAPLPALQKQPWQRQDCPGPAQWQTLVSSPGSDRIAPAPPSGRRW